MTRLFDMKWQAAGPYGIQHMLQDGFARQQRLEFVNLASRRQKALAPA